MKKLLGYQIADGAGVNIQGDDGDPSGHPSYYILTADEASSVIEQNQDRGPFLLMPVFEGDIEKPTFA